MMIRKAMTMISQDLHKVLERRKKGKYRSEKNRKAVVIADMKDILRNYESEMETDVERAMIYGINLAIYNRLTELNYDDFETYINLLCSLLETKEENTEYPDHTETAGNTYPDHTETAGNTYPDHTETAGNTCPERTDYSYNSTISTTANRSRKISSGMIPYRG